MPAIYIGIINVIQSIENRLSLSITIPTEYIEPYIEEHDIQHLENGFTIKSNELIDYPLHQIFINFLHSDGYWFDKLEPFTSVTLYKLFAGQENVM